MVKSITDIFTELGTWITGQLTSMMSVFYDEQGLTILGTLAVIGVGVAVCLLILNMVKSFLRFS